eukprot:scaffold235890_cov33-Tisochrysis_lutea.AAC.3
MRQGKRLYLNSVARARARARTHTHTRTADFNCQVGEPCSITDAIFENLWLLAWFSRLRPCTPSNCRYQPAKLDALFSEGLAPHSQLTTADPRRHRYLACGLLLRGDATVSDAQRSLAKTKPHLQLPWWNPDAFKIGLCAAPPVGQPHALLALSNNCAVAKIVEQMIARFDMLYRKRAHVHHFTR